MELSSGNTSLSNGKYRLLDLVSLFSDPTAVGVIVKIERNSGTILTLSGKRTVPETDIKRKIMGSSDDSVSTVCM
jgi:hypothetical protein